MGLRIAMRYQPPSEPAERQTVRALKHNDGLRARQGSSEPMNGRNGHGPAPTMKARSSGGRSGHESAPQ
jgi:hypothetical protein